MWGRALLLTSPQLVTTLVDMADTAAPVAPMGPAFELRHYLHRAMEEAGKKPEDMAALLGCSVTTVRNYLRGRTTPTRAVLIAWASICEVPFEWLEQAIRRTGWLLSDVEPPSPYAACAA